MWLISSDTQRVSLQFEVDGGVVVADVGHVLNAVDSLRHDIGVFHRDQRNFHPSHVADVTRPDAWTERNKQRLCHVPIILLTYVSSDIRTVERHTA